MIRRTAKPAPADHDEDLLDDVDLGDSPSDSPTSRDEPDPDEAADDEEYEDDYGFSMRGYLRGFGSVAVSMVVHVVIIVALAMVTLPEETVRTIHEVVASALEEEQDDLETFELEQDILAAQEMTIEVVSSSPVAGALGEGALGVSAEVAVDQKVMEAAEADVAEVGVDSIALAPPSLSKLIDDIPIGAKGDPRAIVDDYQEAMSRLTREILLKLDRGPVLTIWCFDQSESMEDDQKEIRERINRVYTELGLNSNAAGGRLATAVTSYGADFLVHTREPTWNISEIQAAIDAVPTDPSGKEIMCQAIGRSIGQFRDYNRRTKRQMMLILVTDESGERDDNDRYLEAAIAEAKASQCTVYTLGREAVFGYPYAYMRWQHPETKHIHWLPVDRGPETAFVEQLQTNGFHRRHDAFASGFGPYEQTRIVRETNGIFFMLPSKEASIVRGEKRRYELEAMRTYRPDLRPRIECLADRDNAVLRHGLWQVINDLNPYNEEAAKIIVMQVHFSPDPQTFLRQARQQQQKAVIYLNYLARATAAVEQIADARAKETDPRWMANYDLLHAQLVAYQARIYEYGARLEYFIQNPKLVPLQKAPNLTLVHWDVHVQPELVAEDTSRPYIEKANQLFQIVVDNHPGTPWAARAALEMRRGYGVDLIPDYDGPHPPASGRVRIPKL